MTEITPPPNVLTRPRFSQNAIARDVIGELGRFNEGMTMRFAPRSGFTDGRPFHTERLPGKPPSYTVPEDMNIRELGALLADLSQQNQFGTLKSVCAERFQQEGIVLQESVSRAAERFPALANSQTTGELITFLRQTADDLQQIAAALNPSLPPSPEVRGIPRQLAYQRMGIDETVIQNRAIRLAQLLESGDKHQTVERYANRVVRSIGQSLHMAIEDNLFGEVARIQAETAYTRLPSRMLDPDHYYVRNEYAYPIDSPEFQAAKSHKRVIFALSHDKLQNLGVLSAINKLDLRIQQDASTLRGIFAKEIEDIRQRRLSGTLTEQAETAFAKKLAEEIDKYGGWYNLGFKFPDAFERYGQATESSPAEAVRTGQMICTLRAGLYGQLMSETGLSENDVMSVCFGMHNGIVRRAQNGTYFFTDFTLYDGDPSFANWHLTHTDEIDKLLLPLRQTDAIPVKTEQLMGILPYGGKEKVSTATVHKGLKGITCVSYSLLAHHLHYEGRDEENVALMNIVTAIDPYNPVFQERRNTALKSLTSSSQVQASSTP